MRPARAFSILELLVVLAIAALLLGALVPGLARLRGSSRFAGCLSNLRQMAIAAHRYALEYDYFPPAIRYELEGGVVNIAWDWVTTNDGALRSPGALWAYTDDPGRVQQCPSYHGPTNFAGDPHTGYNYNTTYVGGEGSFMNWGWDGFRPGVRLGACRRTAQVAVFGDGGVYGGVANKFMRAPVRSLGLPAEALYAGAQAFRHGGRSAAAFLDGRAGAAVTPFRGRQATDQLLGSIDYPENGFLSDDDRAYDPNWGL